MSDEPAGFHKRSAPPAPCPDRGERSCTFPLCDHFCGAPPPPIFSKPGALNG